MNQDQTGSSQKGKSPAKRNLFTLPFFGSQLSQHSALQEKWASLIGTFFFHQLVGRLVLRVSISNLSRLGHEIPAWFQRFPRSLQDY